MTVVDVRVAEIAARAEVLRAWANSRQNQHGANTIEEKAADGIDWLIDQFRESQSEVRRLRSVVEDAEAEKRTLIEMNVGLLNQLRESHAETWDEGFDRGFYSGQSMPSDADASESPARNPYQAGADHE